MKKKLLIIASLFAGYSISQSPLTINQADSPINGLTLNKKNAINPTLNIGNAGTNVTIDISSAFSLSTDDSTKFITTSLTNYGTVFPNSNLTMMDLPDTSITFLNVSSTKIDGVGMLMGVQQLQQRVLVKSTDPLTQIEYPATYNSTFSDDGVFKSPAMYMPFGLPSGTIPATDTAYVDSVKADVNINRVSTIDAWGTITTPYGTYSYIRQKAIDITNTVGDLYLTTESLLGTNSFWTSSMGISLPGTSMTDTTINYYYYTNAANNSGVSLVAEVSTSNQGVVKNAKCSKIYSTAELVETKNSLINAIYPNPVKSVLNLTAYNNENIVNIYTVNGELIYNSNFKSKNINIQVDKLNSGNYFIEVLSNGNRSVNKFVKE